MAKIAIVDLSFTWPPDGGARTDVREIGVRLAKRHDVMLFVPWIEGWLKLGSRWIRWPLDRTRFFWKGKISEDVEIPFTRVSFGPISFGAANVGEYFRRSIEPWKPDHVWIADGWYLKPYVVSALRDFRPVVRIYAHEMLCPKGNGFFYRWGKACFKDHLEGKASSHWRCALCTTSFYATYPSPTWIHEYLTSLAFLPSYGEAVRGALEATRSVIVYNEFTAQRVRRFAKDVRIVPSGVDIDRFRPAPSREKRTKEKVILAMGRTEEPRKGYEVLLRACRLLRKHRVDFELWSTDRRIRPEPWIKSLGWQKFEEMPELYRRVDIAVVPSLWPEPHGIVGLEAMACEVPVVVSRIGGLKEICTDGIDGIQVEPGNAESLAAALDKLLSDDQLRLDMGKKGRRTVSEKYQWDGIVNNQIEPCIVGKT